MGVICNFIYNFYDQLSIQNKVIFFILLFCIAIVIVLTILSLISKKRKDAEKVEVINYNEDTANIEYDEDNDISRIAKQIEKDLEENANIDLTDYETDQENTSIISYQELIAAARKSTNEVIEQRKESEEDLGKTRVFKPSEFISPIYGTQKKVEQKPIKESNLNSEQFLKALKMFRNNLDE